MEEADTWDWGGDKKLQLDCGGATSASLKRTLKGHTQGNRQDVTDERSKERSAMNTEQKDRGGQKKKGSFQGGLCLHRAGWKGGRGGILTGRQKVLKRLSRSARDRNYLLSIKNT